VETIGLILVMLVAVLAASAFVRMVRLPIPLPLVQIALGAAIASLTSIQVELDPEIFFLLFLPPLLFLDGWRIPKQGLFRDYKTILELALGLVVFTVIGMGFFIHWMIPSIPLAVSFALAAVLSPTDPVAVSSLAKRVPIPKRMMHILEGESLLNDASGLVFLRFATAAAMTGVFSLSDAALTFLQLSIGGVAMGFMVTRAINVVKDWGSKRYGEDPGSQILISLLTPFAAYMAAEHFHCSGILAAVAAGITMSYAELSGAVMAVTRVRRNAVWDTVQFALNGIIFVLLGQQLPDTLTKITKSATESGNRHEAWWLAIYVLAITIGLVVMRYLWVWVSLQWTLYHANRKGEVAAHPGWRLISAFSLAGVRGAISLAGILTLPLALPNGAAFPARDLAIFLVVGVIILYLLLSTALLPWLLKGLNLPPEPSTEMEEDRARRQAADMAIKAVENAQHNMAQGRSDPDIYAEAAARVMDTYRIRFKADAQDEGAARITLRLNKIERDLRIAALRAERDEIFRLARNREITDDTARRIVRELDMAEARYTH
jgi:Na+/H+ antiporter